MKYQIGNRTIPGFAGGNNGFWFRRRAEQHKYKAIRKSDEKIEPISAEKKLAICGVAPVNKKSPSSQ
jgi:hypothetical protein